MLWLIEGVCELGTLYKMSRIGPMVWKRLRPCRHAVVVVVFKEVGEWDGPLTTPPTERRGQWAFAGDRAGSTCAATAHAFCFAFSR